MVGKWKKQKQGKMNTIIGGATVIEGVVKSKASLRIDGMVLGTIECEGDVVVGKGGHVETLVKARNIFIAGTIHGDIYASGKLYIQPTGAFNGNAEVSSMIIEEGGIFEGVSKMNRKETVNKAEEFSVHEDSEEEQVTA